MSITVEQLSKNIQEARRQEKQHRDDAAACAGAAQAYEQLLTGLIQAERKLKADVVKAPPGFPPVPGTKESIDLGYEAKPDEEMSIAAVI